MEIIQWDKINPFPMLSFPSESVQLCEPFFEDRKDRALLRKVNCRSARILIDVQRFSVQICQSNCFPERVENNVLHFWASSAGNFADHGSVS